MWECGGSRLYRLTSAPGSLFSFFVLSYLFFFFVARLVVIFCSAFRLLVQKIFRARYLRLCFLSVRCTKFTGSSR
ncbi:hypothetical protein B9Z19DRAFT_1056951 [Tuber borchii]|uniref:Uncharacterized protein n=1 Tax=Tuber borchii TaxID=42251 RepID=A0A2T6ZER6_TUBBO|nr:hypothetical protein B9Z19DRAFT_1056951 [Tuber borchii]